MGRGKKYQPEQVVNLLRKIEVAVCEREDNGAGVQENRHCGADLLPLAQRVWRSYVDQAKRLKELEQ